MRNTLAHNLLTATALTTALLIGSTFASADEKTDKKATKVITFCSGGAQEFIDTSTNNAQVNKAGAVAAPIPVTTIGGGGSGGGADSDLYTVTLSGEADGTVAGSFWTAQAEVSVNGAAFVPIDPVGPNTFFTGTDA